MDYQKKKRFLLYIFIGLKDKFFKDFPFNAFDILLTSTNGNGATGMHYRILDYPRLLKFAKPPNLLQDSFSYLIT